LLGSQAVTCAVVLLSALMLIVPFIVTCAFQLEARTSVIEVRDSSENLQIARPSWMRQSLADLLAPLALLSSETWCRSVNQIRVPSVRSDVRVGRGKLRDLSGPPALLSNGTQCCTLGAYMDPAFQVGRPSWTSKAPRPCRFEQCITVLQLGPDTGPFTQVGCPFTRLCGPPCFCSLQRTAPSYLSRINHLLIYLMNR
jgi:hypothetical protein